MIGNWGGRCCPLRHFGVVQMGHSGRELAPLVVTDAFWKAAAHWVGRALLVSPKTAAKCGHARPHGQTDVVRGWRQREVLTVGVVTPTGASTAVAHSAVAGRPHATGLSRGGSLCRCRPRRGVCRAGRRRHRASGDVQFTSLSSACPPSVSSPPLWPDPRVSGHRLAARARQCLRVLGSVPPARLGPPPPSFILPSAGGVGLPPSRSTMRGHDGQKLQSRPPGPAPVFNDCRRRLAPVARRRVRQPTAAADTMRGRDGQDGRWWRSWRVWRCRRTDAPQRRPRLDERHRPRTGRQTDLGRAR